MLRLIYIEKLTLQGFLSITDFKSAFASHALVCAHTEKVGLICLFVCLVALRHKSTTMVIAGRSVHLTTLFPGQA